MVQEEVVVVQEGEAVNIFENDKRNRKAWKSDNIVYCVPMSKLSNFSFICVRVYL